MPLGLYIDLGVRYFHLSFQQTMLEFDDNENGFVTINLDSSRCDICQLDTGEDLIPCKICRNQLAMNRMRSGFNEMPLHPDLEAHKGCMWKEHQDQGHLVSPGSPMSPTSPIFGSPTPGKSMFDLMNKPRSPMQRQHSNQSSMMHQHLRGMTLPPAGSRRQSEAPPVTPPLLESPGMTRRRFTVVAGAKMQDLFGLQKCNSTEDLQCFNKDVFNTRLQMLLQVEATKENIDDNNPYVSYPNVEIEGTHSNPLSRSGSYRRPPSNGTSSSSQRPTNLHLNTRRMSKSSQNLSAIKRDVDPKFLALKQSYAKYLFGRCLSANDVRDSKARRDTQHLLKVPTSLRAEMMTINKKDVDNRVNDTMEEEYEADDEDGEADENQDLWQQDYSGLDVTTAGGKEACKII